jgi:hypothetical protein
MLYTIALSTGWRYSAWIAEEKRKSYGRCQQRFRERDGHIDRTFCVNCNATVIDVNDCSLLALTYHDRAKHSNTEMLRPP